MKKMKKIIIIDDEINIATVLQKFLARNKNYEVETYIDPQTAVNDIKNNTIDLVMLDVMMPTLNGFEVLKMIKERSPITKVILMTAYSTQNKIDKSEQLQADGYLEKPFTNLKDIDDTISRLLNIR